MTSLEITPPRADARILDDALASPRLSGLVYAALVAAMAVPAVVWPVPRTSDGVDHWARLTLYHMAPDDPLRALYRVSFGLIPNLGVDALYLALSPVLSAQSVVRLAFVLSIALPAFGAWMLHRALFEKPSPTIWLVPFLSYNVASTGGLINYAFGMGLALIGLSFVVRRPQRWTAFDYIALNVFGTALFFCHLIALAAFALLLGLVRVAPLRAPLAELTYRALSALGALAVPLALVALRAAPPSTYSLGGSKLAILFAPVASMTGSDLLALAILLAVIALAAVRGLEAAAQTRLALVGFGAAALLAPSAHGAANLIDARLSVLWWYFAIASTSLKRPDGVRVAAALTAIALVVARLEWVAPAWSAYQVHVASVREALKALPSGARALVVGPTNCNDKDFGLIANLTAFAVTDRRAYVNTLFAQTGIQPVAPADPALDGGPTLPMDARWLTEAGRATLPKAQLEASWAEAFIDWRRHFTYVIDAHARCASELLGLGLTRIGGGPDLDIYRVD